MGNNCIIVSGHPLIRASAFIVAAHLTSIPLTAAGERVGVELTAGGMVGVSSDHQGDLGGRGRLGSRRSC